MKSSIKAGTLFPKEAHKSWMEITGSRYRNMCERLKKKGLPAPTFNLYEFRQDILSVQGGNDDGPIQCRYCNRWFTLAECDVDHGTPLGRGGSSGLDNLDYPCAQDNDRKGGLTVAEYTALLAYLNTVHPLARQDVLSRLEKANKLAAAANRTRMLMAGLAAVEGKSKPKQRVVEEEEDPLGKF